LLIFICKIIQKLVRMRKQVYFFIILFCYC